MIDYESVARMSYEAFGESTRWLGFNGEPLPAWSYLPAPIVDGLVAAARKTVEVVLPYVQA